ncbi:PREDICTED: uncharacterized protein LOC101294558 [Fragaria vesca subsp. vesca]
MAEKNQQAYSSANGYTRSTDQESSPFQSDEELKRQKRIKLFTYIGIFIVFQIVVMTVFGLTVMKVKTPKARWGEITVKTLNSVPAAPSFDTTFETQIRIKNTNWGPYKFDAGTATFLYQGVTIGKVDIPKSKAGMRGTKKIDASVSLNTAALNSSGELTLTSEAKLTGKVTLMGMMKKKKSASMNCTIQIDVSGPTVKSVVCK